MKIEGIAVVVEVEATHPEFGARFYTFVVDLPVYSDTSVFVLVKGEIEKAVYGFPWCDLEIKEKWMCADNTVQCEEYKAYYNGSEVENC